ncbi:GNAT family N-acetyltransferase [Luteococcus sp. H138]|uniref:GNAT family N-acetyltransferase n=1 Tax=unclassified Luteococcus TaxID=2639923 RepID=UPI00313E11E9
MARRPVGRQPRPSKAEVAVSRLEAHHLDALVDDDLLLAPAREFAAQRAGGEGFALVAVVDAVPVGLLGVHTGEGWQLHGLVVNASMAGQGVEERLVAAAEELARPMGSITGLDGVMHQL